MNFKKFNIFIYSSPIIIIFSIVLLAYWPGILVSDSMVQWHEVQLAKFSNWHPAYNTIYIFLLTKIWNHPGFILFVQCLIISFSASFIITRLEKYYKINKLYLFLSCILFALIPLNFNFAVTLLKDTLYSTFILLLTGLVIEIINDTNFFKNWKKCLFLFFPFLIISLFRHNGIIVVLLTSLTFIIKYKKLIGIYIVFFSWLIIYLVLTTIGFKFLNISEGDYANKYGPISHVIARMLNSDNIYFSKDDLKFLSKYVDIKKLKETFNPFNMDYSINSQHINALKESGSEYFKFAIKKFIKYPKTLVKHYIYLTSFLYSPIPFEDSYVFRNVYRN